MDRSRRETSPDRSRPLDFAARQAARGDRDDRGPGKSDRDAQRSSKHSRSDSRDVKGSRHSRERDTGDRHRRDTDKDRPHENGRGRSRDRQTDRRSAETEQQGLPGPPSVNGTAAAPVKKAEPLSLEELLRKKQEEQATLAKVFTATFRPVNPCFPNTMLRTNAKLCTAVPMLSPSTRSPFSGTWPSFTVPVHCCHNVHSPPLSQLTAFVTCWHELLTSKCALQPKFLSKKEREELALKRRQEEVELQKQKYVS